MNNNPLTFTQMSLARKTSERKSNQWFRYELAKSNTQLIPIWQGEYFFAEQQLLQLTFEQLKQPIEALMRCSYLLGVEQLSDGAVCVVEMSWLFSEQTQVINWLAHQFQLVPEAIKNNGFRRKLPFFSAELAANLGYGRALTLWHQSARFCGYCGGQTESEEAGHCRRCIQCQQPIFPRTDPVVIMLVEHQQPGKPPRCLLAGHQRSADNLVSTLAGFVDPGESLEQAVRREVFEEAGISVGDVEYITSQPWPFPHSVMIGFIAQAISEDICIDPEEISHAQWFDAEQVAQFSDWGADNENIQIPRKESIARHLIELWLARQK